MSVSGVAGQVLPCQFSPQLKQNIFERAICSGLSNPDRVASILGFHVRSLRSHPFTIVNFSECHVTAWFSSASLQTRWLLEGARHTSSEFLMLMMC